MVTVVIQFIWRVEEGRALTPQAIERLAPYITRYAQTMGVGVYTVGGNENHLHVLFSLPANRTLDSIHRELQKTTTRFLRETLNLSGFSWEEEAMIVSLSPEDIDEAGEYIRGNAAHHLAGSTIAVWEGDEMIEEADDEALPEWLRDVGKS